MIVNDEMEAVLDAVLGGKTYTPKATVYLGYLLDDPNNAGTGFTEVTGSGYGRVTKTNNDTNFPDCTPGSREKSNGTVVTFPEATGVWGTPKYVGVFDAISSGNLMAISKIANPILITTGFVSYIAVGQLKFIATGVEVYS